MTFEKIDIGTDRILENDQQDNQKEYGIITAACGLLTAVTARIILRSII